MKIVVPFLIAALITAVVLLSFLSGAFSGLEFFFEDLLFSPKPIDPDIVIAVIDDDSLHAIGQWPWPREVFARALDGLAANPPAVLGLDVVFAEPSRLGARDDAALARVLEEVSYPVVLPVEVSKEKTVRSLDVFLNNAATSEGMVNVTVDRDGTVRRLPLRAQGKDGMVYKTLAQEMLERARIAAASPEVREGAVRIVYSAGPGSMRRVPFARLLDEEPPNLAGKIVFVGVTAPDLHDEQVVPVSRGSAMPGVEIHANVLNMLRMGYRLDPPSTLLASAWIALMALLPAIFFLFWKRSLLPLIACGIAGFVSLVALIVLFEYGIAANMVHTNAAWILSATALFSHRYWSGEKERREMKDAFSKYVSKEVLEHILRDPRQIALGGEEKEITVLFSDIRGFTSLSESRTPQEIVALLNRYFTHMTEIVFAHGGVLDKYIGDAIMAFWGAPLADARQGENAVRAGIAMLERLEAFNEELEREEKGRIAIGVGIYTGRAVVGNVGSSVRFDYTAIGDTVNVASRLEGLNKTHGTRIIVGESTMALLTDDYGLQRLGSVEVKGRKEPLSIFGK